MDERTLEALKGSIAKWEAIVAGTDADRGTANCPLCKLFADTASIGDACNGCPVKEKTGERGCNGTPYERWTDATKDLEGKWVPAIRREVPRKGSKGHASAKRAAQAELDFLRSLLPEGERP